MTDLDTKFTFQFSVTYFMALYFHSSIFFILCFQDIITSQEENETMQNEFHHFKLETKQEIIKLKVKLIFFVDLF